MNLKFAKDEAETIASNGAPIEKSSIIATWPGMPQIPSVAAIAMLKFRSTDWAIDPKPIMLPKTIQKFNRRAINAPNWNDRIFRLSNQT